MSLCPLLLSRDSGSLRPVCCRKAFTAANQAPYDLTAGRRPLAPRCVTVRPGKLEYFAPAAVAHWHSFFWGSSFDDGTTQTAREHWHSGALARRSAPQVFSDSHLCGWLRVSWQPAGSEGMLMRLCPFTSSKPVLQAPSRSGPSPFTEGLFEQVLSCPGPGESAEIVHSKQPEAVSRTAACGQLLPSPAAPAEPSSPCDSEAASPPSDAEPTPAVHSDSESKRPNGPHVEPPGSRRRLLAVVR
jgi:hypothetical protein